MAFGLAMVAAAALTGLQPLAHAAETTISVNNLRTGWDPHEPGLSGLAPTESDFGERFDVALEGQIYAQPLIIDATGSTPATLIVATETDKVYALDPDTGAVRWTDDLGDPWPVSAVNCGNINTRIGITSTPVYDPATKSVYVMAKTNGVTVTGEPDSDHPNWRLHALKVTDGHERRHWPVAIGGYPDNDALNAFNPKTVAQRPGLLLLDGNIYAGFASYCDAGPFDGYVAGISTTTHTITSLWTTAAGTDNGWAGIWQSGGGLVSDGQGRIFVATGNGNGTAPGPGPGKLPPGDLSESVIRLGVDSHGKITARDFFSPTNNASLDNGDLDIGSGGPLAIPKLVGGKRLLVQVGKDGRVWLLDRDNLGGQGQGPGGSDGPVDMSGPFKGVWGHPAYWGGPGNTGSDGGYVYDVENQGPLRAFHLSTNSVGSPALTPVATSDGTFGYTSGSPVVTSSAVGAGSAVVWVVYTETPYGQGGDLRAYSAVPEDGRLQQLYSSADDSAVEFTDEKFTTPATDGNRVYFGTYNGHVLSFGESSSPAVAALATPFGDVPVGTTSDGQTVTITALRDTTITGLSSTGPFTVEPLDLPVALSPGEQLTATVTFSPISPGAADGDLAVTTDSSGESRVDHLDVSGYGTQTGLRSQPTSLDYGTVATGATESFNVDIENTGTADATVSTAALEQTDPSHPLAIPANLSGATIKAGETLAIRVVYSPLPGAAESDAGTLTVAADSGPPAEVSLSAASVTGNAKLTVSPNPLRFHTVTIGASVTKFFRLRNTGNIPLTFSKAPPPTGDFTSPKPLNEGATLQPGQTIRQLITYAPTARHHPTASYYFNFSDGTGASHGPVVEYFRGSGDDAIADYYHLLGGRLSSLGRPVGKERPAGIGRYRRYQHGRIFWSPATGAHALSGRVLRHYLLLGGPTSFAGFPISDVHHAVDGIGHVARFGSNNTAIYARAGVGVFEVNGAIRKRWSELGGVTGRLGYPTSDEFGTTHGLRRSNFEHGHITWNPTSHKTKVTVN